MIEKEHVEENCVLWARVQARLKDKLSLPSSLCEALVSNRKVEKNHRRQLLATTSSRIGPRDWKFVSTLVLFAQTSPELS